MTDTAKRIGPNVPGTSDGTVYTAPASAGNIGNVVCLHAENTTTADAWFSLAFGATSATVGNCFKYHCNVPAGGSWDWTGLIPLAAGEVLHGMQQTTGAITITGGVVEIT